MKYRIFILVNLIILLLSGCTQPKMKDMPMNNDSDIYAGYKEFCKNKYIEFKCQEGLECREITNKPHVIKICLYPNEELPEDLIYSRNDNISTDESYNDVKEELQNLEITTLNES